MVKKYWFYIDVYVHISVKKNSILLYNPYSGKILRYKENLTILKLVKRLLAKRNLRVVRITERDLKNPDIRDFIKNIREYFMGDLIDTSFSKCKPIQMTPIVKIQTDVNGSKTGKYQSIGQDIIEYLSELSIYINDQCSLNCSMCSYAYRQFTYCTCNRLSHRELDIEAISSLLNEISERELLNVNILGGNIFSYSKINTLPSLLETIGGSKTYFIHYLNAYSHRHLFKNLHSENSNIKIHVTFPVIKEKLKEVLDVLDLVGISVIPFFIVQTEEDFKKAESLITDFSIENYEYNALYNKENLAFFEENIYIYQEDIEEVRPSSLDIYSRGSINGLNFGKLTVLTDGRIYANVNETALGILGKHSIYDLLVKELKHGKSWRKVRKNVTPCKSCTFEKLCPPISDYNRVIGKYNLCRIGAYT